VAENGVAQNQIHDNTILKHNTKKKRKNNFDCHPPSMNHQRNYVFSPLQDVTASLLNTVNNSPSKSSREKILVASLLVQVNSSTDRCKELFDEVINETIGNIQRTLNTVVSELNVMKADNKKLNLRVGELEADNMKLKAVNKMLILRVGELEADNTKLKAVNKMLILRVGELEADNTKLNLRVGELEADNTKLNLRVGELEADNMKLNLRVGELEADNMKLNLRVGELEADNMKLKADNEGFKAVNTKLNDTMSEINNRTKKLEDRMIVSLFGFTLFHLFFISNVSQKQVEF
jgi:chromosome segregation ATPase